MDWSDEHDKAGPAFLSVLEGVTNPKKTKENPFYHSQYTPLNELLDLVKPILEKNGFELSQPLGMDEQGHPTVTNILLHKSLQWIRSGPYPLNLEKETPQGGGSGATYGRRYTLEAMLGIVSEEDDDGNAAEPKKDPAKKSTTTTNKPPETTAGGVDKTELWKVQNLFVTRGISRSTKDLKGEELNQAREENRLAVYEYLIEREIRVEKEENALWYMRPAEMETLKNMLKEEIKEMEEA